jgi:hypothetical protein
MMGEMDHSEVRELLEDAAIDPDGLERLMAGDTPNAALVAGHLAGCPDCSEELARLHRAVGLIRPVVRAVPPPELRERTLARIAAVGRPRGVPSVGAALLEASAGAALPEASPGGPPAGPPARAPRPVIAASASASASAPAPRDARRVGARPTRLPALVAIAAALIVAVGATGLIVNALRDTTARAQVATIEALGDVARWTLRVDGQPDVRRIALASTTGASTSGSIVFSPASTELVVVADALAPPPAGHEYRCWLEVGGTRSQVGKMFFGGDLAYWVGDVSELAGLGPDVRFGVSLVDLAGTATPSEPVLVGNG